jgi:hypothetical protein
MQYAFYAVFAGFVKVNGLPMVLTQGVLFNLLLGW